MATSDQLQAVQTDLTDLENLIGVVANDNTIVSTATANLMNAQTALTAAQNQLGADTDSQAAALQQLKSDVAALQ